jgi:hypothetical protein
MDGTGDGYECDTHPCPPGAPGNPISSPDCRWPLMPQAQGKSGIGMWRANRRAGERADFPCPVDQDRRQSLKLQPARYRAGWTSSCADAKEQKAGRSMIYRPKSVFVSGETKCRCTAARWSSSVAMRYRPHDRDVMIRRPICLRSSGNKCLPAFPGS